MKFNLSKHLMALNKEAMGAPRFINREQALEMWDYKEIIDAPEDTNDPRILQWRQYLRDEPSLKDMLRIAGKKYAKYLGDIKTFYGMTPEQAQNIFKIMVGYHPTQGGYLCFVGPYFSEGYKWGRAHRVNDAEDRFGYFPQKFRNASPEEITKSLNRAVDKVTDALSETADGQKLDLDLDASDFRLIDKIAPQITEAGEKIPGELIRMIDNLDITPLMPNPNNDPEVEAQNNQIHEQNQHNNPVATDFFNDRPLLADEEIKLNSRGYEKVMKAIMGPWYEEALAEKAATKMQAEGIEDIEASKQAVQEEYLGDYKLMEKFYNGVRKKYTEAVKRNDPIAMQMIAEGYPAPPSFLERSLTTRPGQKQSRKVPTNKDMYVLLGLRKQVAELLKNGKVDVNEIADEVNQGLRKKIPSRHIANELTKIADIKRMLQEDGKEGTYDEVINQVNDLIGELEEFESGKGLYGFKDFNTAMEMLSLHLANPPTLKITERSDLQSKDLAAIRAIHKGDEEEVGGDPLAPEEIAQDIGEPMPEQAKVEVEEAPVPAPANIPILDDDEEEEEEEELNLLNLIGYTVKNLIKIARELDNDGNGDAAEEIHQVIRKYQKRIL